MMPASRRTVHIYFTQDKDMDLQEFLISRSSCRCRSIAGDYLVAGTALHRKYFVGEGKAVEIAEAVKATGASVVLFDHALSPAQERNLEAFVRVSCLSTAPAYFRILPNVRVPMRVTAQVELAQLRHLATRHRRRSTHLERRERQ